MVGLERDRHVLDRFARYSHEQGLARQVWAPEQIVPAGASDSFRL